MSAILLATINARYIHASIALRCLYANLRELQACTSLREYSLGDRPADIAEALLAEQPRILGLAVYIWNAAEIQQLLRLIKRVAPELIVVLGGPEVSHSPLRLDFSEADYIIQGEGEEAFYTLCTALLQPRPDSKLFPAERLIKAQVPEPENLCLPYAFYTEEDLARRITYVEAARGCPFACEFCLSSIDRRVRPFALERFLSELEGLWQRGARTIKFIDRTFNSNVESACLILDFFLAKEPPYHVHFEVIPDHFPEALKSRLQRFPAGVLQLEVGIQTLDAATAARINRRLDLPRIRENLRFLEEETRAHLHVDLIIGLPGESLAQFGANLDTLLGLCRGEVQLGVLKKLSGTAIGRHDADCAAVYSPEPPYEILANALIPFASMQAAKRLARFWDLVYNSGNFRRTAPLLWPDGAVYGGFTAFSAWVYSQTRSTWQISLERLCGLLFRFLTEERGLGKEAVANSLAADILVSKGRVLPPAVRAHATCLPDERAREQRGAERSRGHQPGSGSSEGGRQQAAAPALPASPPSSTENLTKRQSRHLQGEQGEQGGKAG